MKTEHTRPYVQGARAQAAEETGRRIVEAFLTHLMGEWYDEITLDRVASDAGVTVQTIIRRFGGKDGLLAEAVKVFAAQVEARRASVPGDVAAVVRNVVADYEQSGDGIIRLLALEARSEALGQVMRFGRSEHRRWVAAALAPVLAGVPADQRERALDALVVALDVYTWKILRRDTGRGVRATREAMEAMVRAIGRQYGG